MKSKLYIYKINSKCTHKFYTKYSFNGASWIELMVSSKSPNWKDIAVAGVFYGTCLVEHSLDILLRMKKVGRGKNNERQRK